MSQKIGISTDKANSNKFNIDMAKKNNDRTQNSVPDSDAESGNFNSTLKYNLSENGVLIVRPQGPLRKEDFDQLASIVDPWIKAHSKLQGVVICIPHFPGWEDFGSFIHHLEFVESHERKVKRVALAVDGVLPKLISKFASHFIKAEIKQFPFAQEKEAVEWAKESS